MTASGCSGHRQRPLPGDGAAAAPSSSVRATASRQLPPGAAALPREDRPHAVGASSGDEADAAAPWRSVAADAPGVRHPAAPLVDEFTQRLKSAELPRRSPRKREEYVQRKVNLFARQYRERLFQRVRQLPLQRALSGMLPEELAGSPSPPRSWWTCCATWPIGTNLEPLEGPYYESLRNAVAPFRPIAQVMKPDESGNYAALSPVPGAGGAAAWTS